MSSPEGRVVDDVLSNTFTQLIGGKIGRRIVGRLPAAGATGLLAITREMNALDTSALQLNRHAAMVARPPLVGIGIEGTHG